MASYGNSATKKEGSYGWDASSASQGYQGGDYQGQGGDYQGYGGQYQDYGSTGQSYGNANQSRVSEYQGGYGKKGQGSTNQDYSKAKKGYGGQSYGGGEDYGQGYGNGGQNYGSDGQSYSTGGQSYGTGGQSYGTGGQSYGTGGQSYGNAGQGYGSDYQGSYAGGNSRGSYGGNNRGSRGGRGASRGDARGGRAGYRGGSQGNYGQGGAANNAGGYSETKDYGQQYSAAYTTPDYQQSYESTNYYAGVDPVALTYWANESKKGYNSNKYYNNPRKDRQDNNQTKKESNKRRIVEEVGGGDWINQYDKKLPQEIIDKCTSHVCGICGVNFTSDEVRQAHYQGKPHMKKVESRLREISEESGEPAPKRSKASVAETDTEMNLDRLQHFQQAYLDTFSSALPDKALEMCRPSRCDICKLNFSSIAVAKSHLLGKPHDKMMMEWLQAYCEEHKLSVPEKIRGATQQAQQEISCDSTDSFSCEVCNLKFVQENLYRVHMESKKHQAKAKKQESGEFANALFRCEICMVHAATNTMLENHFAGKAHQKKVKSLEADQTVHQTPQREAKQDYNCDVCNVSCNSEENLNSHLHGKSHMKAMKNKNNESGEEKQTFSCEICCVFVTNEEQLQKHLGGKAHKKKLAIRESSAAQ